MSTVVPLLVYDDTTIDSQSPTQNNSTSTNILLGEHFGGSGSFRRLGIFRVDLRTVTTPVLKAEFKLYQNTFNNNGGPTIVARKLLKPYVWTQITWNEYATGSSWDRDIADDDFSSTSYGSTVFADTAAYKTMDLTRLVNENLGTVLSFGVGGVGAHANQNMVPVNSMRATSNKPVFEITVTNVATQSLQRAMLADSPNALWPLNDLTAVDGVTTRDISPNGRHLTYDLITGSAQPASATLGATEPVWNPTTYDYWMTAYASWMNPGSGDWLVTMLYKGTEVNGAAGSDAFDTVYGIDLNDTGNGTLIYIVNKGSLVAGTVRTWYAGTVTQNSIAQQGGVNLMDGNTHQIWIEKRSGVLTQFVDGYQGASNTVGTPSSMSGNLYLGTAYSGQDLYRQRNSSGYVGLWTGTIPSRERMHIYRRLANMALRSGSNSAVNY